MSIITKKDRILYNNSPEDSIDYGNPLSQGLIFACTFNQGNGRKLIDLVTKNVSIPTNSLSYTPYKYGKAAKFAGASDIYFNRLNKYSVANGKLTVSFLYTPDSTFGTKVLITNMSSGTAAGWTIRHGNGGGVSISVGDGITGEWDHNASTTMLEGSKRYYHWTVTVDNAAQEVNWYLDGKIDAAAVFLVRQLANNTNTNLYIGSNKGAAFAEGRFGFVYFWNRELTTQEIFQLNENKFGFIKRNKRKIIHLINVSGGGGQDSTVTPNIALITAQINAPSVLISASQTVTPATALISAIVNAPSTTIRSDSTCTPSTALVSAIINAPTVQLNASQTVQPQTSTVSVIVNAPTTTVTSGGALVPNLATVNIVVNQPTVLISSSSFVSPNVEVITVQINAPTVITGGNSITQPALKVLSVVVNQPTTSVSASRIVQPSLSTIAVQVFQPTTTSGVGSGITVKILVKSKIDKTILSNSRVDKFINMQSEIL